MTVAATNPYADIGLALKAPPTQKAELGQAEFLRLMTTQLQNQDPFKPMESGEFLGTIAQFSTVSGIQSLQSSFEGLAASLSSNQTLQASQMVGRAVLVPSDTGFLPEGGLLMGAADLPAGGDVSVEIRDASGQVVRHLDLGQQGAGLAEFTWDGVADDGTQLPQGSYTMAAFLRQGGSATSVATLGVGLVDSVSLGANGLTLNLLGLAPVALTQVRQIL